MLESVHILCLLGRLHNDLVPHGLLTALHNYWHPSYPSDWYHQSILPDSSTWCPLLFYRTYRQQGPHSTETTWSSHEITLMYAAHVQAAIHFKQDHANIVKDFNFQPGDLVLTHNTAIEKAVNHKMHARYLGPLIVISHNQGKAYILTELDGSVLDWLVATFQVPPFFTRKVIPMADLHSFIDVLQTQLTEMEASYGQGNDDYKAPLDFDGDNDDDIDKSSPNPNWPPSWLGTVSILVRGRGTTKEHSFFRFQRTLISYSDFISHLWCNIFFQFNTSKPFL